MFRRHADSEGRGRLPGRRIVLGLLVLGLMAGARPGEADRWIPIRPDADDRAPADPAAQLRRERQAEVEVLTAGLRKALPRPRPAGEEGLRAEPDTATVMICLLGFRENRRPDLTTVPIDGKFMAATDTLPEWLGRVDPPPHDTAYFDAHMRAMREFYRIQSYGMLDVEWDIVEGPDAGLFLLPDIADYGPGEEGGYWTLELLETFMRTALDSIDAALQADPQGPRFADYEHVMVFHAGSDLQNDVFRDSPNDLPSFNIFFGDWPLVDGGATPLGSVLLLPETSTQDTDPANPVYGALNAVTAHEFGHQLGLVDTYNTLWGWPSVGYWDIMDSGHQLLYSFRTLEDPDNPIHVYGALPSSFSIWHRMLLGWVNEADGSLLRPGGGERDIELQACNLQLPGPKALRVDLSDREYFLLESRQELLHRGGRYVKRDADTGVFQFVSIDFPQFPDSAYNSGEYDLFLPQSGLLAWHVDERDFEVIYPLNEINPDHDRHVRLVEADGAQDLGNPYSSQWRGNDLDPFYTGNVTEWRELSIPSTRLRDGTPSGFELDQLVTSPYLDQESAVDSLIRFHIRRGGAPPGFPRDDRELLGSTLALLPRSGSLLPMGAEGWLGYVMESLDSDTLLQSHLIAGGTEVAGDPPLAPLPPELLDAPLVGSALVDVPGLGAPFWLLLLENATALAWGPATPGAAPELLFTSMLPEAPGSMPLVVSGVGTASIYWLDVDRSLTAIVVTRQRGGLSPALSAAPRSETPPGGRSTPAAPLALVERAQGGALAVAVGDQLRFFDLTAQSFGDSLGCPDPEDGAFWLLPVDLDGDGFEADDELFWVSVDGRVRPLGTAGPGPGFEALRVGARLAAAPAVADLNGDGNPELFLAAGNRVHRLSFQGNAYPDWPLRLEELADLDEPMALGSGLRAADMTGDGLSELIFFADSGHLLVVEASGHPVLGTPRSLTAAPPQDLYAPGGLVYAASRDGYLTAFSGAGGAGGSPDWGSGGGDAARSGRWRRQHAIVALTAADGADWRIYPNPAATWSRLHHPGLPAGTRVRLECFDLEGQLKFSRADRAAADGPFEIELELRSLAAGVYFVRIEVSGDGVSAGHILRRLAVLR